MKGKLSVSIGWILLVSWAAGCAGPSRLALDYGTSHNLAKFNQIHDLKAGKNLDPVEGLDGRVVKNIIDKYQKDFEKPAAPTTTYTFSIGTGMKK